MALHDVCQTCHLVQQVDEVQRVRLRGPPALAALLLVAGVAAAVAAGVAARA